MEPTAKTGLAINCREQGMKWPLLGSATGHLFLLSLFLLVGAAAGPGAGGVVQVILVEGADFAPSGDEESPAGSSGGARQAAIPTGVAKTPLVPLSAAPSSLSPDAAILPPIRIGAEAAPAGALAGSELSGAGDASGGIGGTLPGAGVGGAYGAPGAATWAGPGASGPGGGGAGGESPGIGLLREKIQAKIVYPEEAIRRGQEGEVLLRIRVGEGGIPKEIRVTRSSGARALDEAARSGVVRAVPLPSLPGWFEVPIRFSLR